MQHIAGANAEELKTLIAFFAAPETTVAEAARDMGMTVAECEKAYAFWRGAGIFAESAAKPKKVAADTSSYRNYDSAEIDAALQQKGDFSLICSVAQTKLLAPAWDCTSPSSSSRRYAFWMVLGFTVRSADSARREGSSSPSAMVPAASPCLMYRMICK